MVPTNFIKLKDGRTLGYAEYGDPKGKPLLFFHGWPTSRLHASYLDQTGVELKIRVISIDRPGYGLSDYKPNRTLLDWPDDVIELADQLHIGKFAVMGVSGGGPYAAVCAYKIPERLTKVGIIVGLAPTYIPGILGDITLSNKFGWANYDKSPALRKFSALLHYLNSKFGPSFGLHRFFFGAKADKKIYSDPKMRKTTRENFKEAFKQGYKGAELDLELYTKAWKFDLTKIKVPVFLFYGDADKNVSINMGKYYASQIPNSKLIIYPNEGHLSQTTHAREILKALSN